MMRSKDRVSLGRVLSHDNSAALVIGGEVVAAIAAERLSGRKHDHENNDLAIRYCLDAANLTMDDVDIIVQNSPKHYFRSGPESTCIEAGDPRLHVISHHLAHAWAVWATCPFDEAAIVVVDGRGNFVPPGKDVVLGPGETRACGDRDPHWHIEVESIYRAGPGGIHLMAKHANRGLPASIGARFSRQDGLYPGEYSGYYQYAGLGALYEQASHGLFGAGFEGGKVMGLAAYANPAPDNARRMLVPGTDGQFTLGIDWLFDLPGPLSVADDFRQAAQVAADVQLALEEGMESLVLYARELTGCRNLCLTGGVALNCRVNDRLHRARIFDRIFVQPACSDAGVSIGCAYHGHVMGLQGARSRRRYADFLGRSHDDEVPTTLQRWESSIAHDRVENVVDVAAALLESGKIIGWYRGGSELGPRALGHRSILALPGDAATRERLNSHIKRRESFRPFAPVVTVEAARTIFDIDDESPYMLRTVPVRPMYRASLAAVTHVDGTARIQTVARSDAPVLHALLKRIEMRQGLPVLLNTSLNTAGFPIAETPEDAILCLLSSGLDALVFDGWVARPRFNSLQALLESEPPALYKLLPDVTVRTAWKEGKRTAELRRGPQIRQVSEAEADLVLAASECQEGTELRDFLARAGEDARVLHALLREGWAFGHLPGKGSDRA